MATPAERMEELLAAKDRELEGARATIDELERQLRYGTDWMLHRVLRGSHDALPAPRIELTVVDNSDYHVESEVVLVLPQRDATRSRVPLGYSKRSGAGLRLEYYPTEGLLPDAAVRDLPRLVNDACFYSEQTGLPAYVVLDPEHRYHITSLRPLTLRAVVDGPQS